MRTHLANSDIERVVIGQRNIQAGGAGIIYGILRDNESVDLCSETDNGVARGTQ